MSFLTIPSQEGLFKTIKSSKSTGEAEGRSRSDCDEENDDEEDEDDDEDDDSERVRLIPRCSPVPRKRGASIFDETAEYMRIHRALSAGKRVSFADTTGGDLVYVREFLAFDSDEEDSAKWEEEEAKYRKAERQPTYRIHPEFSAPDSGELLRIVRSNKVEVEQISPVEDEPLAFSGVIRVLNISFHKAVYIRSTMDSWASYFDHPAEYVLGSNDGDTDRFSFKLSFAPPYTTHGSRIQFVVRYETSDGDFWANNSSLNYAVTLLLSYEDDSAQPGTEMAQKRSILKTRRVCSMDDDFASGDDQEKEEEEPVNFTAELVRPSAVCPVIIHPEIDVEKAVHQSGSTGAPEPGPPSVGGALSTPAVFPDEQSPSTSSNADLQTYSAYVLHAGELITPDKSSPSHFIHRESMNRMSEQSAHSSPTAAQSLSNPPSQESKQRSDESLAERVESPTTEAPPVAEISLLLTAGEYWMAAESVSCPSVTEGPEREAVVGLSELEERFFEISTKSTAHHADGRAETPVRAENEGQLSPELTESPSVNITEVNQDVSSQTPSAWNEKEEPAYISLHTSLADHPEVLSDVSEMMFEDDFSSNLMPCIFFLTGVVSLSLVMQTPSALFFIGLLLVLHLF
ncbi:uncharacterized protein si:ch211-167b20.8 isoform X2 [Cyprinodon tularosa]|uniref:uncharacterized protein si:ch211-167b20.8 isoform X2 n=1 Tax=Cyprinodon tularosa TaxID=77115 RepID=UPI0018E1F420|nr:uncharacterized protein si:ch211-167b20.8 isoform X2 [Cyprinodon tularosa]